MTTEELKERVESYRNGLREKSGKGVRFSETGPAGMSLIDALVATVEAQERRIAELERRVAGNG